MLYEIFLHHKRKYPSVTDDLKTALRVLVSTPELGKSLYGFGDVRKLRVTNSDAARGKEAATA